MRVSNRIVLASLNREKFEEFNHLLSSYGSIELVPAEKLIRNPEGLQSVERYDTYFENALAKARLANHASHYPALADDSGIEVDALQGRPGVKSHRYATPKPQITQDQANRDLLLSELQSNENRSARLCCTLVLVIEGVLLHSNGILEGTLTKAPKGIHGFGYDPIFVPQGETQTLGEMTDEKKNLISHRAKALHELMLQLKTHGIVLAKP